MSVVGTEQVFSVWSVSVLGADVLGSHGGGLAERRCSRCWVSVTSVPASDLVSLLRDCCAQRVSRLGRASSKAGWRVAWIRAIELQYGWVRLAWGRVWGGGSRVLAGWFGGGWGGGRVRGVWGARARAGGSGGGHVGGWGGGCGRGGGRSGVAAGGSLRTWGLSVGAS